MVQETKCLTSRNDSESREFEVKLKFLDFSLIVDKAVVEEVDPDNLVVLVSNPGQPVSVDIIKFDVGKLKDRVTDGKKGNISRETVF